MSNTVRNYAGEAVELSNEPIARGGEGAIYLVPSYQRAVVKIYHPDILNKRQMQLKNKIDLMSQHKQFESLKTNGNLTWPLFSVTDNNGNWLGYAMRKIENGKGLNLLGHAKAYIKHFPNLTRSDVVDYLLDLTKTIKLLHAKKVMIGDYNPTNFLCFTNKVNDKKVAFIDCDSWQIEVDNQKFYCPVSVPDMLPPELMNKQLENYPRTEQSELFSFAILLFKILMLGRHPYDSVGGENPVSNIKKGYFPYGKDGGEIPVGKWYNVWSHLSFKIKDAMIDTFKDGTNDPSKRTPLKIWEEILAIYKKEIAKNWHSNELVPGKAKSKKYNGSNSTSKSFVSINTMNNNKKKS